MNSALLVLVTPTPKIKLVEVVPRTQVRAFGRTFNEMAIGVPGRVGFFDWMRPDIEEVGGLRLWFHDDWCGLQSYLPNEGGVRHPIEGMIEILFRDVRIDVDLSCDQAFDETRAYRDLDGVVLLGIDTEVLSQLERESLAAICG
jgi:hypothetical protein